MQLAATLPLAVALLAITVAFASVPPPTVPLSQLGQTRGIVVVEGMASDVRAAGTQWRFNLRADGASVAAVADAEPAGWVRAEGQLRAGANPLFVATSLAHRDAPATATGNATWAQVAQEPQRHLHQVLALSGTVQGLLLSDADGHSLRLRASGPLPRPGPATATGMLGYDERCVCYVLELVG